MPLLIPSNPTDEIITRGYPHPSGFYKIEDRYFFFPEPEKIEFDPDKLLYKYILTLQTDTHDYVNLTLETITDIMKNAEYIKDINTLPPNIIAKLKLLGEI